MLDHIQHFTGVFLIKRLQRIKALAELRKAHRHHGDALKHRHIFSQGFNAVAELLPVVDTLAENDLAVHLDAVFIEPVHFFQRSPAKRLWSI